jgi:hypothetical protein
MKKTHAINPLDFSGRTLQKTYLASLFRKAILIHVLVHSQRITPMASACFRSTVQYSVRHKTPDIHFLQILGTHHKCYRLRDKDVEIQVAPLQIARKKEGK